MHYLIDGYNLLFRVLKPGDSLHDQRKIITTELEKKLRAIGFDATLIFDSHYREDEGSRGHLNALEIVFTAHEESADAYILRFLKDSPKPQNYTVVTSDKTLARLCRLRLAKTESIDDFMGQLNKRYKNKLRPPEAAPAPEAAPPPPAPKEPPGNAAPENCFDYYLRLFEEAAAKEELPPKKQDASPVRSKRKKVEKTPQAPALTDEERWLKAFQREPDTFYP